MREIFTPELERELKRGRDSGSEAGWGWLLVATALILAALALAGKALSQDQPNCRGYIPSECCCTNGWCRVIEEHEVYFDGKDWRATETKKKIQNVYPSKNGEMLLCDNNGKGDPRCAYINLGT